MSTFSFCTVSIFWCVCVCVCECVCWGEGAPYALPSSPVPLPRNWQRRGGVLCKCVCVWERGLSWHTDNVNVVLCCNAAVGSTVSIEEIERLKQDIFIISMISQYRSDLVHGSWQLALQKGWCSYCSSYYVMLISSCLCLALWACH